MMNTRIKMLWLVPLVSTLGIATNGHGAVLGFTDYDAFTAAISAMSSTTEDFESHAPGTTIADGTTLGGIGYGYDLGGDLLSISDIYDTWSGSRFLGSTDPTALIFDGETRFQLDFAPANAVGLFVISADLLFDGDIELAAGNASVALSTDDLVDSLSDGSDVYFLGLVDAGAATLTGADIRTTTDGVFGYNIDDIVRARGRAVPSPGSVLLLALGLAAAVTTRPRRGGRRRQH